jgi:hypothetical protein
VAYLEEIATEIVKVCLQGVGGIRKEIKIAPLA